MIPLNFTVSLYIRPIRLYVKICAELVTFQNTARTTALSDNISSVIY